MSSVDDKYWEEYDGLQNGKHQLLRKYLGGWFPILAKWQGRVLYIDCHAGRGRHQTGHEGSPVLALRLLLNHKMRASILSSTEVHFYLFENNQRNYSELMKELNSFGRLPDNVKIHPFQEDYESHLRSDIQQLKERDLQIAPSFAFVDPYGFTISMGFLNEFLSFPRCELLINFMYRYIDMAIHQAVQADNMDTLFGTPEWRRLVSIQDPHQRAEEAISLFSEQLDAKFVTPMRMLGSNNALKYVLIHATRHEKGRELIKESIWSVTPDGTFATHESDSPDQLVLIVPDPDLTPLRQALLVDFSGNAVRIATLYDWLLWQPYLRKHLHKCLKDLQRESIVEFSGYDDGFAFKRNPLVTFERAPST